MDPLSSPCVQMIRHWIPERLRLPAVQRVLGVVNLVWCVGGVRVFGEGRCVLNEFIVNPCL